MDYGRMSHNISKYYARRDVEDNSDLKNIKEAVFSNYWFLPLQSDTKRYFTLGLGNYSTAHGFFRAAQIIEDEERLITYNELIKTDDLLKNLRGIQGVGKDKKELDEEYVQDAMGLIREVEYEIKEM